MKYLKEYNENKEDQIRNDIITIKKIIDIMEKDVYNEFEKLGSWDMSSFRTKYAGFNKLGFNSDGYLFDLKENPDNTLDNMVNWVIEDGFPIRNCLTGFGVEVKLKREFLKNKGVDLGYIIDGDLQNHINSNKVSIESKVHNLLYNYLNYNESMIVNNEIKEKYIVRDISLGNNGIFWFSIEYDLSNYFKHEVPKRK